MAVDVTNEIVKLKRELNAVILAHNYQRPEVQDLADYLGDSLDLSRRAASTDADVIVFCGVHFMAETAAILSPAKTVLLPDTEAGCPMADMVTAEQLRATKQQMPGAAVVCYVNSTAEVKAESDICCTSANVVRVIESIKSEEIIFVPDQYLGMYAERMTGKKLNLWPGFCPTHARIRADDIKRLKQAHPSATCVVHPECRPKVIDAADEALSTGGMVRLAAKGDTKEMIVGTETGIIHRLKKENPGKSFYPVSESITCPNMKLITPEKILHSLRNMAPVVSVPEPVRSRARAAVERMLNLG